jgi:hypothetical protein
MKNLLNRQQANTDRCMGGKKIGPNRHQGRFNPIFYENQFCIIQILCQSLPFTHEGFLVGVKRLFAEFTITKITHYQL